MAHQIAPVRNADDLIAVRELFREYVDGLGIDLAFRTLRQSWRAFPGSMRLLPAICCWPAAMPARQWAASVCAPWIGRGPAR
jgi:hypothetical protein